MVLGRDGNYGIGVPPVGTVEEGGTVGTVVLAFVSLQVVLVVFTGGTTFDGGGGGGGVTGVTVLLLISQVWLDGTEVLLGGTTFDGGGTAGGTV